MTFSGLMQNGVVVFPAPVAIPDGTPVRVEAVSVSVESGRATLEDLLQFAGIVTEWPEDMAENHDHYLHGAPKR